MYAIFQILSFLRLMDFMIRYSLHQVIYNSLIAVINAVTQRSKINLKEPSIDNNSHTTASSSSKG